MPRLPNIENSSVAEKEEIRKNSYICNDFLCPKPIKLPKKIKTNYYYNPSIKSLVEKYEIVAEDFNKNNIFEPITSDLFLRLLSLETEIKLKKIVTASDKKYYKKFLKIELYIDKLLEPSGNHNYKLTPEKMIDKEKESTWHTKVRIYDKNRYLLDTIYL